MAGAELRPQFQAKMAAAPVAWAHAAIVSIADRREIRPDARAPGHGGAASASRAVRALQREERQLAAAAEPHAAAHRPELRRQPAPVQRGAVAEEARIGEVFV